MNAPLILTIDCSTSTILLVISQGPNLVGHDQCYAPFDHAKVLIPMIERTLKKLNIHLSQLDAFVNVNGPGSFTGLRTGLSTLKGFSFVFRKPVLALGTLQMMAQGFPEEKAITPILLAKKNHLYCATYESHSNSPTLTSPEQMMTFDAFLSSNTAQTLVIKDWIDMEVIKKFRILNFIDVYDKVIPALAWSLFQSTAVDSADNIEPFYLQKAAAES